LQLARYLAAGLVKAATPAKAQPPALDRYGRMNANPYFTAIE
jgi:hypothetical protein